MRKPKKKDDPRVTLWVIEREWERGRWDVFAGLWEPSRREAERTLRSARRQVPEIALRVRGYIYVRPARDDES